MFKRATGALLLLLVVMNLGSSQSGITILAEETKLYEIVQNFENITLEDLQDSVAVYYGSATYETSIYEDEAALSGAKSIALKLKTDTLGRYFLPYIKREPFFTQSPTIANPSGFFFRYEITPKMPEKAVIDPVTGLQKVDPLTGEPITEGGVTMGLGLDNANFYGYHVNTKGEGVNQIGWLGYKGQCVGFIFVNSSASAMTNFRKLQFDFRETPADMTVILDDFGYYSGFNYKAIVAQINSQNTANPSIIKDLSTGTNNNTVILGTTTKMNAVVLHPGSSIVWESDNPLVASVDSNGILKALKNGVANIKISLSGDSENYKITRVTVVQGDIGITCTDNDNTDSAVSGLKLRLRASPRFSGADKKIVWSLVQGRADIQEDSFDPLGDDKDISDNPDVQCVKVKFTDSGKVTIRASLLMDSTVFADYVFNVLPSFRELQTTVLLVEELDPQKFTVSKWNNILKIVKEANELMDAGVEKTNQTSISALNTKLLKAAGLFIEDTSTSENSEGTVSDNNDSGNPNTGPGGLQIWIYMLFINAILIGIYSVRKNNIGGFRNE